MKRTHVMRSIALLAGWLAIILGGQLVLVEYANRPGASPRVPGVWPRAAELELDPALPTLVVFAHPRCPCTRASLRELDRLLATLNGATRTHVVFLSVPDADAEWVRTDLWRHAAAMPGVSVHEDPGGGTATLFGAATSGQVVVYSSAGQLLFQGGITASRGHEGWSAGSESVVAMVRGASAETTATPVFGCPLFRAEAPGGQRGEGS